jgi:zinc protease
MLHFEIERHTLANGLTVVLAPDPAVPVVAVNLWYGVGSRNERPGRTGFAHLFEHMMFQGSKHVPKNRHFELIERAGGSLNATTWFDRTNYFETLPSHQLELALWLESDRMGHFLEALTPETLANQQGVVLNERKERYENQPYGDWDERMLRMLWPPEHPYHHTVIGEAADIAAATLADVEAFFRTFYVPGNAVLTLAGDLEPKGALEVVEADVPLPRVYLGSRIPPYGGPEFHAADLATSILGDGRASRLYRRLVRERGVARDAVSFAFPLVHGRTKMVSWITGYPGADPAELEAALLGEVEGLGDVTEAEVARARALAETRLLRQLAQLATRADLLSMNQLLFGDAGRLNSEVERLRAVTASDVRRFAAEALRPDNRALLHYLPRTPSAAEEAA